MMNSEITVKAVTKRVNMRQLYREDSIPGWGCIGR